MCVKTSSSYVNKLQKKLLVSDVQIVNRLADDLLVSHTGDREQSTTPFQIVVQVVITV